MSSLSSCLSDTFSIAEFRGPGVHHRFDDSPSDDYDMDLDQRTRMLGSRGGRVILLGDGTEVVTDYSDQDAEMFDQSDEEEKDLESQVKKGQASAEEEQRTKREETPGPGSEQSQAKKEPEDKKEGTGPGSTPEEPKMMAPTDSIPMDAQKAKIEKDGAA